MSCLRMDASPTTEGHVPGTIEPIPRRHRWSIPDRLNQLLLDLYRASTEVPADRFLDWAFRPPEVRPQRSIPASGSAARLAAACRCCTPCTWTASRRRCWSTMNRCAPTASFRACWRSKVAPCGRRPCRDAGHCWPYLQRYGLALGLCVLKIDPVSGLLNSMTLYRSDVRQRFDDDDAALMEAVFPHFPRGRPRDKMQRFKRDAGASAATVGGFAACNAAGEPALSGQGLQGPAGATHRPAWRGPRCRRPSNPVASARRGVPMPGGLVASSQPYAGAAWAVRTGGCSACDRATCWTPCRPALRRVAQALLDGKSLHKQIAKDLGLAPATVRNPRGQLNARAWVLGAAPNSEPGCASSVP